MISIIYNFLFIFKFNTLSCLYYNVYKSELQQSNACFVPTENTMSINVNTERRHTHNRSSDRPETFTRPLSTSQTPPRTPRFAPGNSCMS